MNIDLDIEELKGTFVSKDSFKNVTGKKFKVFPFRTNGAEKCVTDFKTFRGVVGECYRMNENLEFPKFFKSHTKEESFNFKLKSHILETALKKTETKERVVFEEILIKLFFKENHEIIKFNNSVIKFMGHINNTPALDDFSKLFNDIFIDTEKLHNLFDEKDNINNLFHQLVEESLPVLEKNSNSEDSLEYHNSLPYITELFRKDLTFLSSHSTVLLNHVEDLFKYYYFFYIIQVANQFESLKKDREIKPFYFSLEWENLSQTRSAFNFGWRSMKGNINNVFAHAICLELLNHIKINQNKIGDFADLYQLENQLDISQMNKLIDKIDVLISFYKEYNSDYVSGSNEVELDDRIKNDVPDNSSAMDKKIRTFLIIIKFVLEKTKRDVAAVRFANWIVKFAEVNFLKKRGRSGYTTILSQDMLLFLVKLAIGNNERMRLKDLWLELKKRGILFDEISKTEIVSLFEKINLLEKKSDSGDAQYVKSFI